MFLCFFGMEYLVERLQKVFIFRTTHFSHSVQGFVDSAGDYAVKMVNNLLDMLTKGQHTRTNHALEQVRVFDSVPYIMDFVQLVNSEKPPGI